MKLTKKLTTTIAASAIVATMSFAPVANAELGASVSVANMYLWRGFDLGDGSAAVSGDIVLSGAGFYGGVWASSGDDALGSEYDLFVGYGGEVGIFSYDLSVWNYNYPDAGLNGAGFGAQDGTAGELSEAILSLGLGPVSLTYYDNIAGGSGYTYITLGATFGAFSVTLGQHSDELVGISGEKPTHLDLSYAYNDNVSFTVSKFIADEDFVDDDAQFVVSYSLPIE